MALVESKRSRNKSTDPDFVVYDVAFVTADGETDAPALGSTTNSPDSRGAPQKAAAETVRIRRNWPTVGVDRVDVRYVGVTTWS